MILSNTVAAFLLAFPALFSIVNPLGGAIIFNEVTALQTHAQRVALARRVAIYSTFVMLVALWAGTYILSFFGISLNALRIAGGIVVAVRAYEMLSAPDGQSARKEEQAKPVGEAVSEDLAATRFSRSPCRLRRGRARSRSRFRSAPNGRIGLGPMAMFYAGATVAALAMAVADLGFLHHRRPDGRCARQCRAAGASRGLPHFCCSGSACRSRSQELFQYCTVRWPDRPKSHGRNS